MILLAFFALFVVKAVFWCAMGIAVYRAVDSLLPPKRK